MGLASRLDMDGDRSCVRGGWRTEGAAWSPPLLLRTISSELLRRVGGGWGCDGACDCDAPAAEEEDSASLLLLRSDLA